MTADLSKPLHLPSIESLEPGEEALTVTVVFGKSSGIVSSLEASGGDFVSGASALALALKHVAHTPVPGTENPHPSLNAVADLIDGFVGGDVLLGLVMGRPGRVESVRGTAGAHGRFGAALALLKSVSKEECSAEEYRAVPPHVADFVASTLRAHEEAVRVERERRDAELAAMPPAVRARCEMGMVLADILGVPVTIAVADEEMTPEMALGLVPGGEAP